MLVLVEMMVMIGAKDGGDGNGESCSDEGASDVGEDVNGSSEGNGDGGGNFHGSDDSSGESNGDGYIPLSEGKLGAAQRCRRKRIQLCEDSKNSESSYRPWLGELNEHRRRLKEQDSKPLLNEILKSPTKVAREKARKTPTGENWLVAHDV
ncbi:hypothetical protein PoB_003112200 [Plakobranchus ocellatus]|uniref:Uncharacterized protein n=1 Tax=Plakobranchus ocellatus TaxID=259542 RepID=A0AAV4ACJ8_9GAST|nr:hypothetical protein PoB_003112200 [Plakobranchus ocellatus]